MSQPTLFDLLDELIILINGKNLDSEVTVKMIAEANDGIIKSKYTETDILYALKHISDEWDGAYRLNRAKIEKAIALRVLSFKPDGYRLSEFVSVLKSAFELGIPSNLTSSLVETHESAFDPKQNLFEHYKHMDLSCLVGQAVIIPYEHQRVHERNTTDKDDIIIALNPYFHPELAVCMENVERKIEVLFKIKEKWTARELKTILKDFCEPDVDAKFDIWLNKNSRTVKG